MALLDMQDMETTWGGDGGGNSSLSLLCHSSHSITVCL
ncbi:MAG: SapB/AmfS family lanthipeptide [Gemmatimonadota bacterium]